MNLLLNRLACGARLTWLACRALHLEIREVSSHPDAENLPLDFVFRGPCPEGQPRLVSVGEQWSPARLFNLELEAEALTLSCRLGVAICVEAPPRPVPLAQLLQEVAADAAPLLESMLLRELLRHGYKGRAQSRRWAGDVAQVSVARQLPASMRPR